MWKYQANISIVVLWVLSVASLLGLYIFYHINQNIQSFSEIYGYYQSFYMAKAGTEVGLVLANNTEIGFEDVLSSGNIVNQNFTCRQNGMNCGFELSISSRNRNMIGGDSFTDDTNKCKNYNLQDNSYINIAEGQSFVIPLLFDSRKLGNLSPDSDISDIRSPLLNHFAPRLAKKNYTNDNISLITKNKSDITLSFFPGVDNLDTLDRDILVKSYTGIDSKNEIINDFLYDDTPAYYNKDENNAIVKDTIDYKVKKFAETPSFLVIQNPKHCSVGSLNSGDILQISQLFDFGDSNMMQQQKDLQNEGYTVCQKVNESDKTGLVWTNCKCPNGEYYDYTDNTCISQDTCDQTNSNPQFVQSSGNILSFCIDIRDNLAEIGIPTKNNKIVSNGFFGNYKASMGAIQKMDIPERLLQTSIETSF